MHSRTIEQLPQGVLAARQWVNATFYLPRSNHLPVEVELKNGTHEFRNTSAGDWREVTKWRSVELTPSAMRKLKHEVEDV